MFARSLVRADLFLAKLKTGSSTCLLILSSFKMFYYFGSQLAKVFFLHIFKIKFLKNRMVLRKRVVRILLFQF